MINDDSKPDEALGSFLLRSLKERTSHLRTTIEHSHAISEEIRRGIASSNAILEKVDAFHVELTEKLTTAEDKASLQTELDRFVPMIANLRAVRDKEQAALSKIEAQTAQMEEELTRLEQQQEAMGTLTMKDILALLQENAAESTRLYIGILNEIKVRTHEKEKNVHGHEKA